MSVCWQLVCDARKEKLWCGQNDYLYTGEPETMKDLSAFLYASRGHTLRVVTDLTWGGPEDDYTEVGSLNGQWEVRASNYEGEQIETRYLGVYDGSRRQALAAAAAEHFPDETYYENTDVLTGPWRLEAVL